MRSSAIGVLAGLALGGGGCNLVLGVERDTRPCGDESFSNAAPSDVTAAELFSVSWDGDRMVYASGGVLYEQALPAGEPAAIDATLYPALALALAPEGDAMFITAQVEPPLLQAAVRSGPARWAPDAIVPAGALAGSPSAAEFGPRRVLVRLRFGAPEVQEYEADDNRWAPVGDIHAIGGTFAPNLTPSGLDMVYGDSSGDSPAVFVAHRASTAAWFGAPVAIMAGAHAFPQLLDRCRALYTLDTTDHVVRRYER